MTYGQSSPRCMSTPEGGFAVLMTNKTGAASVKGEVLTTGSTIDNSVVKVVNEPQPAF